MITLRKLQQLAPSTRRRKIVRLLEEMARHRVFPSESYLLGLLRIVAADADLPAAARESAGSAGEEIRHNRPQENEGLARALNDLRHELLAGLDLAPGDWDLIPPAGYPVGRDSPGASESKPGVPRDQLDRFNPAGTLPTGSDGALRTHTWGLYLDGIRSPFNLGSIVRTAAAFGVPRVGVSRDSASPDHPRAKRSAMGAMAMVEIVRSTLDEFAAPDSKVVVLELGGIPIGEFVFPDTGVLVLGSEEFGVRENVLGCASARVSIPLPGRKASLNVGVACGIALQALASPIR